MVYKKYNLEVFFVVCYETFRRQPCYGTFILGEKVVSIIRASVIFKCGITNWPGFVRRPRFVSNACSSLHSSPVYFESCLMCII